MATRRQFRKWSLIAPATAGLACAALACGPAAAREGERDSPFRLRIAQDSSYQAFPHLVQLRDSLLVTYSSGPAHGNSEKRVMARSDDGGATWRFADIRSRDLSGARVSDTSLIDDLLDPGETVLLRTDRVERTAAGEVLAAVPTVAPRWSSLVSNPLEEDGAILRVGNLREARGEEGVAAVFESRDGGSSWSPRSVITERTTGEGALLRVAPERLLVVLRANVPSGGRGPRPRPLYSSSSPDGGRSWTEAVLLEGMEGVQPFLLRLRSGRILLLAGHRTGASGFLADGAPSDREHITGIAAWLSADGGATWGPRTMLARTYSTDGGQPRAVQLGDGSIFVVYYNRRNRAEQAGIEVLRIPEDTLSAREGGIID